MIVSAVIPVNTLDAASVVPPTTVSEIVPPLSEIFACEPPPNVYTSPVENVKLVAVKRIWLSVEPVAVYVNVASPSVSPDSCPFAMTICVNPATVTP